jgi:hypothetical protein
MSYLQLFARESYRTRNTQTAAVIVGTIFGLFGCIVVIALVCNRNKPINAQNQRDLEAQRARERVNAQWPRQETTAERRTRQAQQARDGRAARRGEPAPPLYEDVRRQRAPLSRPLPDPPVASNMRPVIQRPALTLTADDMRRQQAPLSRQLQDRPLPDPDRLPKYEEPPAYDSPAVWSTRG